MLQDCYSTLRSQRFECLYNELGGRVPRDLCRHSLLINIKMKEIWKDIDGYEGLYQVSNLGRVKSLMCHGFKRVKILKGCRYAKGYLIVNLYKSGKPISKSIHRLVASAFIPNTQLKKEVNHLDANKVNNYVDNLEWCTTLENVKHAIENGLRIEQMKKTAEARCIPVIDTKTQTVYQSIKVASKTVSISPQQLSRMLNGVHPNKTNLQFCIRTANE